MTIKVTYIATLEEYYHADDGFRLALKKGSVDFYLQIVLWVIAIAFLLIDQYFIGCTVALVAFITQQGYVKRWIVRRNFNNIVNGGETETLTFSNDHIVYECGVVHEVINWEDYGAYLELDQLFMLFYDSSDHYAIVPKRALENDSDLIQLRQLIVNKLANYGDNDV